MKTLFRHGLMALALLALTILNSQLTTAHAQGTAFTYQGRLDDGTNFANGKYDVTFALFTTNNSGLQTGVTLTNAATAVSNGLFVATLDFGGNIFTGTNYWLAVGVRTNGNGNGTFTALSPRQPITPTPYAIYAANAAAAATSTTANGVAPGSVTSAGIASGQVVKSLNGLHDAVILAGGNNIQVNMAGNLMTIASTVSGGGGGTNGWSLTGNAGTASTNFLGTTDNQNLQLKVNGQRALLLQPNFVTNTPNFIGGSLLNAVSGIADTIAGGYQNVIEFSEYGFIGGGSNSVIESASDYGFIGGGNLNQIQDFSSCSVIGGGENNSIDGEWNTIAGGMGNVVTNGSSYSIIGGGQDNVIQAGQDGSAQGATIAGGFGNVINGLGSFIGGGANNNIYTRYSVIAGGYSNITSYGSSYSLESEMNTVGGGHGNAAKGIGSTVPGGEDNVASGQDSFAAGTEAQATNDNCFVWATGGVNRETPFASTGSDQFLVGPNVSVGINTNNPQTPLDVNGNIHTSASVNADYSVVVGNNNVVLYPNGNIQAEGNISSIADISAFTVHATFVYASSTVYANGVALTSDRNAKENFKPVDYQAVLAKVASLPVTEWNYKTDSRGVRHIGPMAQDFQAAFGLDGKDDKHISVVDEGGVALAAIQGMNQKLEQKETEITELKARLEKLEQLMTDKFGGAK